MKMPFCTSKAWIGWSGNIRQLRNVIDKLIIYTDDSAKISLEDIKRILGRRGL